VPAPQNNTNAGNSVLYCRRFPRFTRRSGSKPPMSRSVQGANAPPEVPPELDEELLLDELLDDEVLDELLEEELLLDELLDEELLEDELVDEEEELTPDFTKIPVRVPLSACVETVMVRLPSDTAVLTGVGV
jgi:hypothetical protein